MDTSALAMIKAVYDDGEAGINGRKYKFTKMTHKQRRKVFAYFTKVAELAQSGNFSFLDTPEFESVEGVINNCVTYNDSLLSRIGESHWEKYPDDYVTFISTALQAISYPFFPVNATGSKSE